MNLRRLFSRRREQVIKKRFTNRGALQQISTYEICVVARIRTGKSVQSDVRQEWRIKDRVEKFVYVCGKALLAINL